MYSLIVSITDCFRLYGTYWMVVWIIIYFVGAIFLKKKMDRLDEMAFESEIDSINM